jgi:hypothetical protein
MRTRLTTASVLILFAAGCTNQQLQTQSGQFARDAVIIGVTEAIARSSDHKATANQVTSIAGQVRDAVKSGGTLDDIQRLETQIVTKLPSQDRELGSLIAGLILSHAQDAIGTQPAIIPPDKLANTRALVVALCDQAITTAKPFTTP